MEIRVGDQRSLSRTVSSEDVARFALVTGDANPVHLDAAYAATTRFGRPIAHGMLCGGMISAVLGTQLPGPGAIYLSQSLQFRAPAFVGDTVVASVTVIAVRADKPIVTLRTECRSGDGTLLVEGEAVLLVPERVE